MRKKGCVLNYWILAIAYLEVRHAETVRTRAATTVELPGKVKCHPLHWGCYLQALIWITVLLSSAASSTRTPEDTSYIARETVRTSALL